MVVRKYPTNKKIHNLTHQSPISCAGVWGNGRLHNYNTTWIIMSHVVRIMISGDFTVCYGIHVHHSILHVHA